MDNVKMIVGLGNPGPRYADTRHNIGFQCVALFAKRHNLALDKMQLKAMTGSGFVSRGALRQRVLIAKPLTWMNLSGEAVAPLARYYNVAQENLIVVHDDLDLDSGRLRLRADGSSGGQNGIKSIIEKLGSQEFARVRVGIGRPPGRMDAAAWVLQDFSRDEESLFGPLRERVCDALETWLFDGIVAAMNKYNVAA
jgi:PTH1 family peptidyl-tRNA hydrolase